MSNLQEIYKNSYANRTKHGSIAGFYDGGEIDFATPTDNAQYMTGDNSGAPGAGDISAETSGAVQPISPTSVSISPEEAQSASGQSSSSTGAIGKALAALGLGGGNSSNTAALNAAVGLLSAYGQYKGASAAGKLPTMPAMGALPALPGSSSAGYGPAGGYAFSNYTPSKTQAPSKAPQSYYTYGSGPEQQFFQQVQPGGGPIAPVAGSARGGHIKMAAGGAVPHFDMGGMVPGGPSGPGGGMLQQGLTPMSPRPPMMGAPGPQGAQPLPAPRPMMPPPQAPRPPQAPPSTMMQRMQQQPRPGMRPFADGGAATPMIAPNQMAQSGVMSPQMPHGLAQVGRRGPQPLATSPFSGRMPMIQQRADGGPTDPNEAGALTQGSRHVTGPGDGTSDSIPARLANGEYVIDAQAVSMLGNGDNSAGAKRLDEFRKNLRQHKGGALSKGRMAPDAKPIHKYMGGQ